MTIEEIKNSLSMPELLRRYHIETKRNMCHCPFHGDDKHPSMKVYNDAVYCFTCNFRGDIFDVYREFEHCDFKTAFKALGGAYEHDTNNVTHKMKKSLYERQRAEKKAKEDAEKEFLQSLLCAMEMCRLVDEACEAFSDSWKYIIDHRDWLNWCYELKYLEGKEINEIEVFRVCREVGRAFYSI